MAIAFAAALAVAIGIGAGIGICYATAKTSEAIARQPEAADKIRPLSSAPLWPRQRLFTVLSRL